VLCSHFKRASLERQSTKYKAQSTKHKAHFAAVVLGAVNVISTRRFLVRPATVVFGASGFEAPMPLA
jgi:hypothetical protein